MQDRQLILKLAEKFWPGPFTMVLPKREIVPEIVTAGLDTVAVRISAHPVFAEIVRALDKPLAAPSANRFGRISPTTAQHVLDELDGRIPLIIDAGPTNMESNRPSSLFAAARSTSCAVGRSRRSNYRGFGSSQYLIGRMPMPRSAYPPRDSCLRITRRKHRCV